MSTDDLSLQENSCEGKTLLPLLICLGFLLPSSTELQKFLFPFGSSRLFLTVFLQLASSFLMTVKIMTFSLVSQVHFINIICLSFALSRTKDNALFDCFVVTYQPLYLNINNRFWHCQQLDLCWSGPCVRGS